MDNTAIQKTVRCMLVLNLSASIRRNMRTYFRLTMKETLMIADQLLCQLELLHKSGRIHG
jgi:hypothetical protein